MIDKFQKIKESVKAELSCSAHDMAHVMRVYNLALHMAEGEDVDMEVLKAAALLHDIARVKEDNDPTGKTDHAVLSAEMAVQILQNLGFSDDKLRHIQDCIISHRYRTGNTPKTIEAQILHEADKLDTLGAIGIARAFAWVGKNNASIYRKVGIEDYARENLNGKINGRIQDITKHSVQIEFETKLRLMGERFITKRGKELFKVRFQYFKNYLDRLEKEIKGDI